MDIIALIILIGSPLVVTTIVFFLIVMKKAKPKSERNLSFEQFLPPDIHKAEGIKYHRQFRSGSKNSAPSISLRLDLRFPAPIRLSAESGFDRFGKAIGLASEFQTQDKDFDREIYIDCAYQDYAAAMFWDTTNRQAIRRCFAKFPKLAWIALGDKKAEIIISPAGKDDLDENDCMELVATVAGLHEAVQGRKVERNRFKERIATVVMGISGGLSFLTTVLLALGLVFFPSLDNGIFITGILGGLVFFVLTIVLSYGILKGKPGTIIAFVLAMGLGLANGTMGGIGAAHLINGLAADSPLIPHEVMVTEKSISRGKNSTSYYLDYVSWRDGQVASLSVSQSWYDAYNIGDTLIIESRMGKLGYEFLVDYQDPLED